MLEWWRKAELSADRAGLLAGQDPAAVAAAADEAGRRRRPVRRSTRPRSSSRRPSTSAAGDLRDSIIKIRHDRRGSTHPLPVARAAELRAWIDSGSTARILAGDYPRRDDDGDASVTEDVKAAAASYREAFSRSQDPLVGLLRKLGDGAADVGDWVGAGAGPDARAGCAARAAGPDGRSGDSATPIRRSR